MRGKMKRFVISVTAALAGYVAMLGLFGVPVAAANVDYSGLTYAKASEKIAGWGGTAQIATVVGSQLATADCIVVNTREAGFLNSSGALEHSGTILLDLNCNLPVASPGKPGNSAASPQGKDAKLALARINRWNQNPESCSNARYCQAICDTYGGCSNELLQYVAG